MTRLPAALLLGLAAPAQAQTELDLSALVAAEGLRGAEAAILADPARDASDLFGLGAVRVLAGVERALQLRWRVGMSGGLAEMSGLPILRLPLEENPAPEPFEAAMIEDLFLGVSGDMGSALEALGAIEGEVAVVVDTGALWFDVDADGARGPGEGVLDVLGTTLSGGFGEPLPPVTVRFDTADAAWLAAYAHLLSGVSEGVLALDPAEAVGRVLEARAALDALGRPSFDGFALDAQFGDWADLAAMAVIALEGQPDPDRTRIMRDHLLSMIEENRRFWEMVPRETDDDREWIPNKRQASVLGLPFPPDTGARWLGVLAEAEAVLTGQRLIPFWRLGEGAGLDLALLLEDPPEVDVAGLIQGATLLPYLRRGPLARAESLWLFQALVGGDAALYAVVLN